MMCWSKFGTEYSDELADAAMSDAAFRTHTEALMFLYRIESRDLRIKKHVIRRFAGSGEWQAAVRELVAKRFWREDRGDYVIEHHAVVYRGSVGAQRAKRSRDREAQKAHRAREKAAKQAAKAARNVSADVSTDASAYVGATQTDRQTYAYREGSSREGSNGDVNPHDAEFFGAAREAV
jgi:hypothetical protein